MRDWGQTGWKRHDKGPSPEPEPMLMSVIVRAHSTAVCPSPPIQGLPGASGRRPAGAANQRCNGSISRDAPACAR